MAFYEDLGRIISQTGQDAVQKAQNYAEVTRLTGIFNDIWKKIDEDYCRIGEMYFEEHQMHAQGNPYQDLLYEIMDYRAQASDLWEQICKLKGLRICPQCGSALKETDEFCNRCGARLQETPQETPQETLQGTGQESVDVCTRCGSALKPGQRFCTVCGQPADSEPDSIPAPVCWNCGSVIQEGTLFCVACGVRLDQEPEQETPYQDEMQYESEQIYSDEPTDVVYVSEEEIRKDSNSEVYMNGKELGPEAETLHTPMPLICPSCGSPLDENDKFCMICGQKL